MLVSSLHKGNVLPGILVTVLGIVTLVSPSPWPLANALELIPVTGKPLIVGGMTNALAESVRPVIVTCPPDSDHNSSALAREANANAMKNMKILSGAATREGAK